MWTMSLDCPLHHAGSLWSQRDSEQRKLREHLPREVESAAETSSKPCASGAPRPAGGGELYALSDVSSTPGAARR